MPEGLKHKKLQKLEDTLDCKGGDNMHKEDVRLELICLAWLPLFPELGHHILKRFVNLVCFAFVRIYWHVILAIFAKLLP